jgi:D-serine deaminase-like pyridoxal phosphate-dependent protein
LILKSVNNEPSAANWFKVANLDEIESPGLLIYPERVEENIRRMIAITGEASRLRPHVKTHKLAQIVRRNIAAGITKFKAATIAEAEMLGEARAADVLLAYQPVGPNARRFVQLTRAFPLTAFACLVDDFGAAQTLSQLGAREETPINVLLDIDCGQHRTGVAPNDEAAGFYAALCRLPGLKPSGLHAYDGHISMSDPVQRERECEAAFAPVAKLREHLIKLGLPGRTVVAGGTPTFPFHARRPFVECSPGTSVLWDCSYSSRFADLYFLHAALVLTRVVSKPGPQRLCLDLGHKAIASENPHPRVCFLNAPGARAIAHSEEHLVIEVDSTEGWNVGDCLFGIPWHVCPTVALHREAVVIQQGRATERWRIEARDRHLAI